ncbi:TetR/AcrR family transcriptional regulator [Streptomyces sp. NBC_01808]|uniref:TetR/AcrR family transcriptional regulator n=1 Tax=Streptomyces sp. NBC_01808 TaxID=2975947 RepID=UPI002DDAB1F9|nr:TetR/AcrR family transcriptional regulator [Streptomyces sp. NBC_01808]WSA41771.1 TetR/AcrR family transcriptional regulator [Streptomyces sp. NBC_01808]
MTASPRPRAGVRPRRRADAERSIARIVAAAREELRSDPAATTDDIAKAAGVGRMTLYGHFKTRADLVDAALRDAVEDGDRTLAAVDLAGDAYAAMRRLLVSSWALVAESAALLTAAQGVLPAGRVRELHEGPAARVGELVRRGRDQGVFRTDMPTAWLVGVVQHILHGAAEEVRAGRLEIAPDEVSDVVTKSVLAVLATPAGP